MWPDSYTVRQVQDLIYEGPDLIPECFNWDHITSKDSKYYTSYTIQLSSLNTIGLVSRHLYLQSTSVPIDICQVYP